MPRSLLELENTSSYPITTAPALVFRGEQLVAQSRTEYTAIGGTLELDLTAAVNIRVELEGETERREVVNEEGMSFWRFDASGEITLENFLNEPVRIGVERYVAGEAKSASGGGEAITLTPGQFGMPGRGPGSGGGPGWSSLPGWWQQYNATGVVRWEDVELLQEEPVTLTYEWEYLWRR
jgi:hypothetical protein